MSLQRQNLFSNPTPSTSNVKEQSNSFLQSIETHFQNVLKYENSTLQMQARSAIPIDKLQLEAIKRMRELQMCIKKGSTIATDMTLEDAFLVELLNWFKTSYFTWVDTPPCDFCTGVTKYSHNTVKTTVVENLRVEVFKCTACETLTEFPRYNDPAKLLITRRGRCGEWANCFTLLCRALNYEARLVVDTTDHVWTEVYSHQLKKWLHCDPCENVIDCPLLYEAGWKKQLNYIIAYSRDEVQDVTWRYTSDHKAVLARRKECSEQELLDVLLRLREQRWRSITEVRQKYIRKRLCLELVDFMTERQASEDEKNGRSSGSLTWRLQRQETSDSHKSFTWTFDTHESLTLRYSTSKDAYTVALTDGKVINKKIKWQDGAHDVENMQRKEEHDWKMVYLARTETAKTAKISWKIISKNKSIDKVVVKVSTQIYEDAEVEWTICCNDTCTKIPPQNEGEITVKDIDNLTYFTLSATLKGGKGDCAWQHSQILRQSLLSDEFPLQIFITFNV